MSQLVERCNQHGLAALLIAPGRGPKETYTSLEREHQEVGRHCLPIHDEVSRMPRLGRLFVTGEHSGNACGQVQVATMGGRQPWMALLIMQEHQRTTDYRGFCPSIR